MSTKDQDPKLDKVNSLPALKRLAETCTNCELYKNGNLVFGEGKIFDIVMVGEQPGNDEEIKKRPFVGPSGKLLKSILEEVGLDPEKIYFTNAVKHFRFQQLGKRRIHQKPKTSQIRACRIWLDRELKIIKPKIIVCLGKTAAESVLLTPISTTKLRGKVVTSEYGQVMITFHPSFFLRQIDHDDREKLIKLFKKDLLKVLKLSKK
jgi:uracil-DNA glycosylase family protein